MSISRTVNLLDLIAELEVTMNQFSFENLSTQEATSLKQSFENFKTDLEDKIYRPEHKIVIEKEPVLNMVRSTNDEELTENSMAFLKKETITPTTNVGVNLEAVLEDCFGEVEILEELIGLFKQNVLEFIGHVKTHLDNTDLKEVALAAHKMKAGVRMINADYLTDLVVNIELSAKEEDKNTVTRLYETFLKVYPENEAIIDKAMNELKK
ncbi:Hpt domain-containing protein [Maribacter sp. 2210JD10-5]|uniref:Hpt domain-containing protein n=1 Tax=Maribacter sp. 2210JD10-5 TaxID=3386272 RepID=UPI0039BCA1C7